MLGSVRGLAVPVLLVGALVAGCSQAEDAVRDAASKSACSVAGDVVDAVQDKAGEAVDRIGADPEGARRDLVSLRDRVATAQDAVPGEVTDRLGAVRDVLDDLIADARKSARGVDVDTSAVDDARGRLDDAIADVAGTC